MLTDKGETFATEWKKNDEEKLCPSTVSCEHKDASIPRPITLEAIMDKKEIDYFTESVKRVKFEKFDGSRSRTLSMTESTSGGSLVVIPPEKESVKIFICGKVDESEQEAIDEALSPSLENLPHCFWKDTDLDNEAQLKEHAKLLKGS